MKTWQLLCVVAVLAGVGCNRVDFDDLHIEPDPRPFEDPNVPIDARAAIVAETPPPPISGGTLLIVDGFTAVASDPDRDRVSIVDLASREVIAHVPLNAGDEPGRLVEGAHGRVHVVLRGSGELATLDLGSASVVNRTRVCGAPSGVAYEAPSSQVHVACQGGELVSLRVAEDPESHVLTSVSLERTLQVATDLRDVVLTGERLMVTRFKSAELIEVDRGTGVMTAQHGLRNVLQQTERFSSTGGFIQERREFQPAVAWRAVPTSDGKVAVVHQRAMSTPIQLEDPHSSGAGGFGGGSAGGGAGFGGPGDGSSYGGGSFGSCDSIVQSAVSVVDEDGYVMHTPSLSGSVLPVDAAISPDGRTLVVVNAGLHDPAAPTRNSGMDGVFFGPGIPPFFQGAMSGSVSRVSLSSAGDGDGFLPGDCVFENVGLEGQPTAIAFAGDHGMVVQSREPAMLILLGGEGTRLTISLGGDSVFDTGHDIFHRDAGGGIACASCHPGGSEDGHVWNFSTFGARRTQPINVGLEGTEPFHWSGDMPQLSNIVAEVFVQRMGGARQTDARLNALANWMFVQQPAAPLRAANDPSVMRGHELFNAPDVGCVNCHAGDKLTNNETVDVGTGEPFQVPTLVGVAYRAPFMHNGCAPTLRARFDDASCGGGDLHGQTSHLNSDQINDLVAYMESL